MSKETNNHNSQQEPNLPIFSGISNAHHDTWRMVGA